MRSEQEKTPRQERRPVSLMSRLKSSRDSEDEPAFTADGGSLLSSFLFGPHVSPFSIIHCLKDKGEPLLSSPRPPSHYGGNKPAFKKLSNLPRVALDPIQTPQIHSPEVQLPQPPQGF